MVNFYAMYSIQISLNWNHQSRQRPPPPGTLRSFADWLVPPEDLTWLDFQISHGFGVVLLCFTILFVFPVWKVYCNVLFQICILFHLGIVHRVGIWTDFRRPDKFCQFLTRPFSSDQGLNWNQFASDLGNTFYNLDPSCTQNSIETFNISIWWHCNSTRCGTPWDKLVPMAFVRWAPPSAAGYRHIPSHIHGF